METTESNGESLLDVRGTTALEKHMASTILDTCASTSNAASNARLGNDFAHRGTDVTRAKNEKNLYIDEKV